MDSIQLRKFERFIFISRLQIGSRPDLGPCWLWNGKTFTKDGYAQFWTGEKNVLAHRFYYEHLHGVLEPLIELDHLCEIKRCINPSHLEPVTRRVNALRALHNIVTINANKTHCVNGHEFTPENTYVRPDGKGLRQCKTCAVARTKAWRDKQ